MEVTKYVITNNLSVLYNTGEMSYREIRKVDSFTCNNIVVRFITAYPPVTGVAS